MSMIKGVPIILLEEAQAGTDSLNQPIYTETETVIENVLIAPASTQETTDSVNLYGKKAVYTLAIPKGDTHEWRDVRVKFFGKTWETFGEPLEGIEDLIPLEWNKKIQVAIYE